MRKTDIELATQQFLIRQMALDPVGYLTEWPVPIEKIGDFQEEFPFKVLDTLPYSGTRRPAVAAYDPIENTILFDERFFEIGREEDVRFAWAHEISHGLLHRLASAQLTLFGEGLPERVMPYTENPRLYQILEWQATYGADCLLIPRQAFSMILRNAARLLREDLRLMRPHASLDELEDGWKRIREDVSRQVSSEAIVPLHVAIRRLESRDALTTLLDLVNRKGKPGM